MADLHSLDWRKLGTNNFLKKFATMLEDTEQTLVGIGSEDYLRHAREVACLEDMLPKVEKVEYAKRYTSYPGTDYEKFKAFLTARKVEIDRLDKMGVSTTSYHGKDKKPGETRGKCDNCGKPGHHTEECRLPRFHCGNCDSEHAPRRKCRPKQPGDNHQSGRSIQ